MRLTTSSKGTELLSLYTILPSFIKIGQELFELIDGQLHTQTDRQTDTHRDRQIHANKNNTSPKNKVFGRGKYVITMLTRWFFKLMPIPKVTDFFFQNYQ